MILSGAIIPDFQPPNGLRYPRVGGVWIRSESRKNSKPEKSLENGADSHTSGARCVGRFLNLATRGLKQVIDIS